MDEHMELDGAVELATEEMGEMECEDRLSEAAADADDLDEEGRDQVSDMNKELWEKIRDEKKREPSMFVSGWEEDEEGLEPGNQELENEQFLTAAENGDVEKLKSMYEKNPALLSARDRDFYTPLHRAAYNNQIEAVEFLLNVGANPELRTEDGWTVLHSAAYWAAFDVVAALLRRGVSVNSRSNGNLTPLHLAVNSSTELVNQIKTIRYLLDTPGIDMSALSNAGETPFMLAKRAPPEILHTLKSYLNRP